MFLVSSLVGKHGNARWIQANRRRGTSRQPASVERVERLETADLGVNIGRTARAWRIGPILSARRAPVTIRAAKLIIFVFWRVEMP